MNLCLGVLRCPSISVLLRLPDHPINRPLLLIRWILVSFQQELDQCAHSGASRFPLFPIHRRRFTQSIGRLSTVGTAYETEWPFLAPNLDAHSQCRPLNIAIGDRSHRIERESSGYFSGLLAIAAVLVQHQAHADHAHNNCQNCRSHLSPPLALLPLRAYTSAQFAATLLSAWCRASERTPSARQRS